MFVGDAGVGKTALAEGLATRLLSDDVPELLEGAEVFSLDTGALLAGTRFRGDFEERFKAVINALSKRPMPILFIDEIHSTVGAGATTGGTMDLATLIKPILTAGQLRVVGSTTHEEFKHIEKDRALARRLQKITIDEPSIPGDGQDPAGPALAVRGAPPRALHRRRARGGGEAGGPAPARLQAARQRDRFDRRSGREDAAEGGAACARSDRGSRAAVARDRRRSTSRKSSRAWRASRRNRRPPRTRTGCKGSKNRSAASSSARPRRCSTVARAIKRSRAGLGQPDRPAGCFLFTGPTGVGKTELAKQLAMHLGNEFIALRHERVHGEARRRAADRRAARICRLRAGRAARGRGAQHPYSVVLLDEIEKAHPDIFNILLQVMDHATLTDNNGRKADFRQVVLIMTSNAGSRELSARSIGFCGGGAGARARRQPAARPRSSDRSRRSRKCSARNSATGSTRSSRSVR